jgi:hypothetical protein
MQVPHPSLPTMPCIIVCRHMPDRFLARPQLLTRIQLPFTRGGPSPCDTPSPGGRGNSM